MTELTQGNLVRSRREALGLSREEFARQAGTSTSTIARLELNNHLPSVRVLAAIASLADVSIDAIVGEKATA